MNSLQADSEEEVELAVLAQDEEKEGEAPHSPRARTQSSEIKLHQKDWLVPNVSAVLRMECPKKHLSEFMAWRRGIGAAVASFKGFADRQILPPAEGRVESAGPEEKLEW